MPWPALELETLAGQITGACLLEATARKPGNVHPQASFADLTYADFVVSAEAIGPALSQAREVGVGRSILNAVLATRQVVSSNTNLGMILLLAPLAAAASECGQPLTQIAVQRVLHELSIEDSRLVFQAIRAAQPGGMGEAGQQDLATEPTLPLVDIMQMAMHRDRVARQYATGFREVFDIGLVSIEHWVSSGVGWEEVIIGNQLDWLASGIDTLIARKLGHEVAEEASTKARHILQAGWPAAPVSQQLLLEFDQWLRHDGHRRNPGTTADLVAVTLWVALHNRVWRPYGSARQSLS